jgi:hypothetical protein
VWWNRDNPNELFDCYIVDPKYPFGGRPSWKPNTDSWIFAPREGIDQIVVCLMAALEAEPQLSRSATKVDSTKLDPAVQASAAAQNAPEQSEAKTALPPSALDATPTPEAGAGPEESPPPTIRPATPAVVEDGSEPAGRAEGEPGPAPSDSPRDKPAAPLAPKKQLRKKRSRKKRSRKQTTRGRTQTEVLPVELSPNASVVDKIVWGYCWVRIETPDLLRLRGDALRRVVAKRIASGFTISLRSWTRAMKKVRELDRQAASDKQK